MFKYIKKYFYTLRVSSEKVKHRSAIIISIIISIIILSIGFLLFKDHLFIINKKDIEQNNVEQINTEEIESPWKAFLLFFNETKEQFSSIKSTVSEFTDSREFLNKLKGDESPEEIEALLEQYFLEEE